MQAQMLKRMLRNTQRHDEIVFMASIVVMARNEVICFWYCELIAIYFSD
jgi:hypothetical protein